MGVTSSIDNHLGFVKVLEYPREYKVSVIIRKSNNWLKRHHKPMRRKSLKR